MKRLPKVATEMVLHVLAYNVTHVMSIVGIQPLIAAIQNTCTAPSPNPASLHAFRPFRAALI